MPANVNVDATAAAPGEELQKWSSDMPLSGTAELYLEPCEPPKGLRPAA